MVMLIPTTGVKLKVAVSSLVLAPHLSTANSALVPLDNALRLEEVVVLALLILDLTTASGFILVRTMTAITQMLTLMPDFPVSKLSEDPQVLSVSLVPSIPRVPALKPLSASSIPAVEAVAMPS